MIAMGKRAEAEDPYGSLVVDAVESSDLPPVARHLMVTLCGHLTGRGMHTGRLGEASPSLSTLARITGWKPTAVKKHLAELERMGWLIRDQPPVKLQRAEKAVTKYTVRIPGQPPDLSALSRTQGGREVGRDATKTRRRRSGATQPPRCRVCHQPLDTDPVVAASGVHPCCAPDDAADPRGPRRVIPPEEHKRNAAAARAVVEAAVAKSPTNRRRS
jgi:hypothetical protein